MHKFVSVLLPSSGKMNRVLWWKWGKLSVLQAVHFTPQGCVFETLLVLYRRASQFFPAPEVAWARKKGKKACFSSPTPRTLPGADHKPYFLCNGYCLDSGIHRTPQVNRDHFTSLFFITQIQNSPDSWGLFTLNSSPCPFQIERTQLRDRGSPEPLERLLHLNVVELYHPLRQEGTGSFQALTRSRTQLLLVLLPQYLQAESLGGFSQACWASFSCSPHPVATSSAVYVALSKETISPPRD